MWDPKPTRRQTRVVTDGEVYRVQFRRAVGVWRLWWWTGYADLASGVPLRPFNYPDYDAAERVAHRVAGDARRAWTVVDRHAPASGRGPLKPPPPPAPPCPRSIP